MSASNFVATVVIIAMSMAILILGLEMNKVTANHDSFYFYGADEHVDVYRYKRKEDGRECFVLGLDQKGSNDFEVRCKKMESRSTR